MIATTLTSIQGFQMILGDLQTQTVCVPRGILGLPWALTGSPACQSASAQFEGSSFLSYSDIFYIIISYLE